MFRRTGLSRVLLQSLYPILPTEVVYCESVPVLRAPEAERCRAYQEHEAFEVDFDACPGLHLPKCDATGDNGEAQLSADDESMLRRKIRTIFQVAKRYGNDAVVLGPIGCGAWRNPPRHVARITKEECERQDAVRVVVVACLEVKQSEYIVRDRARDGGLSNYAEFSEVFSDSNATAGTWNSVARAASERGGQDLQERVQ